MRKHVRAFHFKSQMNLLYILQVFLITIYNFSLLSISRVRNSAHFYMYLENNTEKVMAPHSSTFAWQIPRMEEPGRLQSIGSRRVRQRLSDFTFTFHFSLSCIGEGNGNPLQCSCLEDPRDGGASWAAIYGVAQSWTRLT